MISVKTDMGGLDRIKEILDEGLGRDLGVEVGRRVSRRKPKMRWELVVTAVGITMGWVLKSRQDVDELKAKLGEAVGSAIRKVMKRVEGRRKWRAAHPGK